MGRVKDLLPEQTDPVDDLLRVEPDYEPRLERGCVKRFTLTIDVNSDDPRFSVNPSGHLANVLAAVSEDVRDVVGLRPQARTFCDTHGKPLAYWDVAEIGDEIRPF
jgi:hypothetical protein